MNKNSWNGWTYTRVAAGERVVNVPCTVVNPEPKYMPIRTTRRSTRRTWKREQLRGKFQRHYKGSGDFIALMAFIIGGILTMMGMFGVLAFDSGVEAVVSMGMFAAGAGALMYIDMRS